MPETRPSFPFYPKDWLGSASVAAMPLAAQGLYVRLLAFAWPRAEEGLPADEESLRRIVGVERADWRKLWPIVAPMWHERNGRLFQRKLEEVRSATASYTAARREAGRKGGLRRAEAARAQATVQANIQAKGKQIASPQLASKAEAEDQAKANPSSASAIASSSSVETTDDDRCDDLGRSGAAAKSSSSVVSWTETLTAGQLRQGVVELLEVWRQHGPEGSEKPVLERLQPQTKRELGDALRLKSITEWQSIFEKCKASDYLAGRTLDEPRPVSLFRAIKLADKIEAGEYRNFDEFAVGGMAPGWTPPAYRLSSEESRRALGAAAPVYVPPAARAKQGAS